MKLKIMFILASLLMFSVSAIGETIFFGPVKSMGISEENLPIVKSLFFDELVSKGFTVVKDDSCKDLSSAYAIAAKEGATSLVTLSITKLGEKIIFASTLNSVETKELIYSNKLTTTTIDESDIIVVRLVKSLFNREKTQDVAEVGTVVENENRNEITRKQSFISNGLMLGGSTIFNDGPQFGMSIGTKSWYETPQYAGELGTYWHIGDYNTQVGLSLAFVKFFSASNTSPFISLGIGYAYVSTKVTEDNPSSDNNDSYPYSYSYDYSPTEEDYLSVAFGSFSPKVSCGFVFLRTYDFRFIVEGNYTALIPVSTIDNNYNDSKPDGIYHSFGVSIGLMKKGRSGHRGVCTSFY